MRADDENVFYRRHMPHYQPAGAWYHVVFRLAGSLPNEVIERMQYEREYEERQISEERDSLRRIDQLRAHRSTYFQKFDALLDGSTHGPCWLKQDAVASIVHDAILHRDRVEYDLYASTIMPNHVHMVFMHLDRFARTDERAVSRFARTESPAVNRFARTDQRSNNETVAQDGSGDPAEQNGSGDPAEQDGSGDPSYRHVNRFARTDQRSDNETAAQDGSGDPAEQNGSGDPSYVVATILGSLKKYTARRANKLLGHDGAFWQNESYDHVIRDGDELERTVWYVLTNPVNARLVKDWKLWAWTYVKPGLF